MITKNQIKQITALSQKKHRDETNSFVAEGTKLIQDLAPFFTCKLLVATKEWLLEHDKILAQETVEATLDELKKASSLKNPQGVLAVFQQPESSFLWDDVSTQLSLALDTVQDPGNLGTIIRIADWFGIRQVFCSELCADVYGSKTVQATMGALARVQVHYVNLNDFLHACNEKQLPVYGTFLDGENIYEKELNACGIIVMGNEGNGISTEIEEHISEKILFPNYPEGTPTSESLNVAMATALVCSEFRRRRR